jgi:membrane protein required for colicin V production
MPLGAVDAVLAGVLLLSMLVGAWRGLVFELLSIAGWIAAWIAAQQFSAQLAPQVPIGSAGSGLNLAASFALVFVGALIAWAIAARLVRLLLHATPLSAVDRLLGALFGLLRGAVLLLAVAYGVGLTPLAAAPAWKQSLGAGWLNAALRAAAPLLPVPTRPGVPA